MELTAFSVFLLLFRVSMKKRSKPPAALLAGLYVMYITITHTDAIIGKSGYVCGGTPVERPGGLSGSILFRESCTLIQTGVSGRFSIPGITGDWWLMTPEEKPHSLWLVSLTVSTKRRKVLFLILQATIQQWFSIWAPIRRNLSYSVIIKVM